MKKLLNITQCQIQKSILLEAVKCIIYCLPEIILIMLLHKQIVRFFLELKMHLGSVFVFSLLSLHHILSYFVILKIN